MTGIDIEKNSAGYVEHAIKQAAEEHLAGVIAKLDQ